MGNEASVEKKHAYSICGTNVDSICEATASVDLPNDVHRKSITEYFVRALRCLPSRNTAIGVRAAAQLLLSPSERSLLCKTWVTDFDQLYVLGTDIYTEIFRSAPEARHLFPVLANKDGSIKECASFRKQALKFVQVISLCVNYLDNKDRLDEVLMDVGARHVKFLCRGFKMSYWNIFESAMTKCILDQIKWTNAIDPETLEKAEQAWRKLSRYIIEKMKVGLLQEMTSRRRSVPS